MGFDALAAAACCALPVLLSLLAVRVAYVLCRSGCPPSIPSAAAGVRCLIVLGSGGHTAEMMNIITALQKDRFMPRVIKRRSSGMPNSCRYTVVVK